MNDKLNLMGVPVDVPAEQPVNVIKVKNDRVLMSDTLRGTIPEIEGDELEELASNFIMVVIDRSLNGDVSGVAGTLRSLMTDDGMIELEIKTQLDDALTFVSCSDMGPTDADLTVLAFELHPGEDNPIRFEHSDGYRVSGCRLMDIDYRIAMCTLLLQLRPRTT